MNSILQLKGRFEQRSNRSRPGSPKLPKGKSVSASHLRELEKQLERILVYLDGKQGYSWCPGKCTL